MPQVGLDGHVRSRGETPRRAFYRNRLHECAIGYSGRSGDEVSNARRSVSSEDDKDEAVSCLGKRSEVGMSRGKESSSSVEDRDGMGGRIG